MRPRDDNISACLPVALCIAQGRRRLGPLGRWSETRSRCLCPGDFSRRGTTQQRNTHIRDVREIFYGWHPWHGRTVHVRANLVKRGRPVAYCSLEDVPTCRVLEVPLWMLDVATCCKTRLSQPGFTSVPSLRELKDVLQSAPARIRDHTRSETQHRYLLEGCCGSTEPKTGLRNLVTYNPLI
jgi:hypothetical protein